VNVAGIVGVNAIYRQPGTLAGGDEAGVGGRGGRGGGLRHQRGLRRRGRRDRLVDQIQRLLNFGLAAAKSHFTSSQTVTLQKIDKLHFIKTNDTYINKNCFSKFKYFLVLYATIA
jgi:hypothetical protein